MIVKNGSDDILSSYWNNEEGAFQVRYSCIQRVEDKLTQYKFKKFVFFIEINIIFYSENKVF